MTSLSHFCCARASRLLLAVGLLCALPTEAFAHDFTITKTRLVLDGSVFRVEMICDLDALLLGRAPGHDPLQLVKAVESLPREERQRREQRLRSLFERRVRVRSAGQRLDFAVSFPDGAENPASLVDPPSVLGVTARLEGDIPEDAEGLTFWASRAFSAVRLEVAYDVEGRELEAGEQILGVAEESAEVALRPSAEVLAQRRGGAAVFADYAGLGFLHIVPRGLDHILFVLGLVLLTLSARDLLLQVSCFTLAHTLTLALSTLGFVRLPSSWVEPIIALSIAYVAVENVLREDLGRSRLALVFAFGLVHGLGFAGVLGQLGLPRGQLVPALLGFNLGVEFGQLSVVVVAALLLKPFVPQDGYRARVVVPASILLALTGLWMAVSRVL
ncbi:MAG: HupE/UreJ family protein [Acidobacteriota bacterium]